MSPAIPCSVQEWKFSTHVNLSRWPCCSACWTERTFTRTVPHTRWSTLACSWRGWRERKRSQRRPCRVQQFCYSSPWRKDPLHDDHPAPVTSSLLEYSRSTGRADSGESRKVCKARIKNSKRGDKKWRQLHIKVWRRKKIVHLVKEFCGFDL